MLPFCKISSMKLTCLVLLGVAVGSTTWSIWQILASGHHWTVNGLLEPKRLQDVRHQLLEINKQRHLEQKDNYALWKIRLKEKWERHKKKLQQSDTDNTDDTDNYTNGSFKKYVDLSPEATWNLNSLWDYFADTPSCKHPRPILLILVTSSPENFDRRLAIRKAWTSRLERQEDYQTVFLLGKAPTDVLDILVENEMDKYGDVLRGNYSDSYRNLTLKVLHGLTYARRACNASYVLKTDDDCFVNVPLILDFLERHNRRPKTLYVGKVLSQSRTKVIRNPGNKWHVPRHLYPPDFYPPYPSGHGYIISGDLLEVLLNASTRLVPFPNEDAYIGVLMNAIGVKPISTYRFTLYNFHLRICNLLYLMVIHNTGPNEQSTMVNMALMAKRKCPGQAELTDW